MTAATPVAVSTERDVNVEDTGTEAIPDGIFRTLYKFSRPHTIRGTILASLVGVVRAVLEYPNAVSFSLLQRALMGLLGLLLGNVFIVGINQIYDVDIDKINKPFLPVASQDLSLFWAWVIVTIAGSAGPAIVSHWYPGLIFKLYAFGLTVGALYSVPPFQFKRFPVVAGATIACVRGFLLNFGVYYAARQALGLPFAWNPPVMFLASFMTVFAGVIAVTKDLPDVQGDRQYNISTFATRVGVERVALAASCVLMLAYTGAILAAALTPFGTFRRSTMIGGHAVMMAFVVRNLIGLDPGSVGSVKLFYKRIWDLFYAEYALYPFI